VLYYVVPDIPPHLMRKLHRNCFRYCLLQLAHNTRICLQLRNRIYHLAKPLYSLLFSDYTLAPKHVHAIGKYTTSGLLESIDAL
jgi:hypothetical protein